MLENWTFLAPLVGLLGLVASLIIFLTIRAQAAGDGAIAQIAEEIHNAAMTFMRREVTLLFLFAAIVGGAVGVFIGIQTAIAFFTGAICSSVAGFIGMYTATQANVRTTIAARDRGAAPALSIAFFGGSVMGLTVASMGLLGIGGLFLAFITGQTGPAHAHAIEGFAMGASLVALFYRVGGGIFTKAADVGADLVGKVEAGIPEDDPRNPGVIADNVGDNVGDVAGMGSDIFESYCGAQIATIAIAATMGLASLEGLITDGFEEGVARQVLMFFPLAMTTVGLVCSLVGILAVKAVAAMHPARALRIGTLGSAALFMLAALGLTFLAGVSLNVWAAVVAGAVGGVIVGLVTEYYTGGRPVRTIAESSQTGVATVMITGLGVGLQSVVIPLLTIAGIVLFSYMLAGEYGVGVAAVGMLATVGITMAIDAYGPIADNAGGIAEMAGLGPETRKITDSLDAVGNTTAAIGKGFAISAAGLAALTMVKAYINTIGLHYPGFELNLSNAIVLVGIFIGGCIPFLNGAITMRAVGDAAHEMIDEIRRQFREIPGLLDGSGKPDAPRCVDIATKAALKRMVLPASLAVGSPVVIGFLLGGEALGGMLIGALLGCILLALMMANAGGAWDNAKKYVEEGHFGGKGSESHKATVVGDTVGDPLKDTSGPSMNILINVMAIVSLVIAPLLQPDPIWTNSDAAPGGVTAPDVSVPDAPPHSHANPTGLDLPNWLDHSDELGFHVAGGIHLDPAPIRQWWERDEQTST